jgi:hypothetical protein
VAEFQTDVLAFLFRRSNPQCRPARQRGPRACGDQGGKPNQPAYFQGKSTAQVNWNWQIFTDEG